MQESTELQSVDFALGSHILKAFQGYSPESGPSAWREFIAREPRRQVVLGSADSPRSFLSKYTSQGSGKVTLGTTSTNLPDLPIVYFYRSPGFSTDAQGMSIKAFDRTWFDDDLLNGFSLTALPVVLEYQLALIARDTIALDKMALAFYGYLANRKKGNDRFTYPVKIAGETIEGTQAFIGDPSSLIASDISEQGIYGIGITLSVSTTMLVGASTEVPALGRIVGELGRYIRHGGDR